MKRERHLQERVFGEQCQQKNHRERLQWLKVLWIIIGAAVLALTTLWIRTMIDMPLRSHSGPLPAMTAGEVETAGHLKRHVTALAGEIGERNLWRYDSLLASAGYIKKAFGESGLTVTLQGYQLEGKEFSNIVAQTEGTARPEKIVLVGAHYDSVIGCPGANDNASGVAALLELGRLITGEERAATVRLVAFVNEEPPFFQTDDMGSLVYAREAGVKGEELIAVLSLETIGCYSDEEGSQSYPPPFNLAYPDQGNFIAFIGNTGSKELVRRCIGSFRGHTAFPSEGIAAPAAVPGVGWSDHWSFWQEGYQAVMVTDTAPYRYEHYHAESDTPDRIDYDRMARVVAGLHRLVRDLAGHQGP